jgi:hypothetical protein
VKSHEWMHKIAEEREPARAELALKHLHAGKPVRVVLEDGEVVIRQVADNQFSVEAANRRIKLPKESVELILWWLDAEFQGWRIKLDKEQ